MEARLLAPYDEPEAAHALALAFQDDPGMSWCFPDPARRRRILGKGFSLFLRRVWLPEDACFSDPDHAGAACWLPPGKWHLPLRRQLSLAPSMLRVGGRYSLRFLRAMALAESKHPREPEHWYLVALGVRPDRQGRGLGSRLMFPILERCDRDGMPAYLEASTPRNRALYERHGFYVTEELHLPKDGPPIWLMWREPR